MDIDSQIPVLELPSPSKFSGLLAMYTTLICRNAGFSPKQVCGNKAQVEASLSSQPQEGGMKNMRLNISLSIM
jgi:hypothetical protein